MDKDTIQNGARFPRNKQNTPRIAWQQKKIKKRVDSNFIDERVERREEDINENKSSQFHDIEFVEFLDGLDFNNYLIDDDYIEYIDEIIYTYHLSTER